jgi:hypothetical protein
MRTIARWVILLCTIVLAALYLNSAAASAWVAIGPPNAFPDAWTHRAVTHLCTAGALLFAGVGAFRGIGSFPRVGFMTIVLGLSALLLLAVPHVRKFLIIDSCLDSGGRWEATEFRCQR